MSFGLRTIAGAIFGTFICLLTGISANGAETRRVEITENGDYFGFDLRTEKNVTLDQCKSTCLGDNSCRAFTYNPKVKWCFLKSDFNKLNPAVGSVAGKIVSDKKVAATDIGAPPALSFISDSLIAETRKLQKELAAAESSEGLATLIADAKDAMASGDPRTARNRYYNALINYPEESAIWSAFAHASLATEPSNTQEGYKLNSDASSAAYAAYQTSRTKAHRATALDYLARALEKRDMARPALQAYAASLAIAENVSVRAAYDSLKERRGFRIVDHSVDIDSLTPRVCAQFSEDLVKTGVEYPNFVQLDGATPKAVEAKGRQICVEGLEHGRQYNVTFRQGLPAAIGETLIAPVNLSIYVQDRPASVRFTGESFVLPAKARRGIPLVSVNMDMAKVKLYRVGDRSLAQLLSGYQFLRQLDTYDVSNISDGIGAPVWEGQIELAGKELNKEVTTSFPIDEALPKRQAGVYVLTAEPLSVKGEDYSAKATQWFVVSDIGLSTYTGQDGINVFARSLETAQPLKGVKLTLLAKNNEILGEATTDGYGQATFTPGLTRGTDGMAPAVLMASGEEDDFVFLDMARAGFDLSDRGVTGRAAPKALDVFAWTERGIYRAGEVVHAAALARDDSASAVDNLPLTFIFSRPDGVEDRRLVSESDKAGGHAVDLRLSPNAMRGTWNLSIYTDPKQPAVANQLFLVEDFVPDRIEFDLEADKKEIAVGETANVSVDSRFLYGAPAAGLAMKGEVTLTTKRSWERFPGYFFGLADETEGEATQLPLENLPTLGEDGKATFPVLIGELPSSTRLANAGVTVRVRETGGRAVERKLDLAISPQGDMIGIKPQFNEEVPQGATAAFNIIAANNAGERKSINGALWTLYKIERNYQWYRSGNSWNYEPVTLTKAISNGKIDLSANADAKVEVPVDWGRYSLQVETADPAGPTTSYEFDAGWYVSATSTETPDGLEIALDKEHYAPGDTAQLKVSPRFAGELLITIGAEKLLTTINESIPAEGATIDIPVGDNWGAGAYVTATLFRPGDSQESRMPSRAIGLKWLKVDPTDKRLSVKLEPPAKIEPRSTLSIPVSVEGADGEDAYVMVAAVDVGILNLTRYQPPSPENWFFGQRQLGLELRDMYGRLIDGSLGASGKLRTGGDGSNMSAQGSPPTEKLVALFSGPVQLDSDGKATIEFDIPQFNGTARVMAVAWTKKAVGEANTDVIIRDPVVVTAGLPRFMAPGDQATLRLDVANTDAPDGSYRLAVETTDNLGVEIGSYPDALDLKGGKRQSITVPLNAKTTGAGGVTIRLANDSGLAIEQNLALPVRPVDLPITTRQVVNLNGNGGSLRIDGELLSESLLDGASISIGVNRSAAFDVPSLLMALDRYPYGCAEQTTSRALPLLYLSEFGAGTDPKAAEGNDEEIKKRVQDAVFRVLNNQSSSGSFGLWGPGSGDLWLDAYVTDFLTRAREKGYDVPQEALISALSNLQNALGYNTDISSRGNEIAYAIYVLARNKKASVGDLRYYADTQLNNFSSPMAIAQLGAALALYNDNVRSERLFKSALELAVSSGSFNYSRSDYASPLRDGAAILALAAETKPEPKVLPALVTYVGHTREQAKYLSTQDQAWMLLAIRALKQENSAIQLDIDGTKHNGPYAAEISGNQLASQPVVITNHGAQSVDAVVTAVAAPAQSLPAGGDGFKIERTYYTLNGEATDATSVNQNERLVVVLKIDELNEWSSRLLVTDLLPSGFEIDNPGLVSSASLNNFSWLENTQAAHLEFRDDRFVAAFDRSAGTKSQITLAYVVRAVTPGLYTHPAASVEDMYRPQYSARTSTGMMEVAAQ